MGEGPKDLRDDAGRLDAPRNDDMVGRGEPDIIGRGTTGAEPLTPATSAYAYGSTTSTPTLIPRVPPDAANTDTTPETAEIRAEIEQKRAEISETIDEITQRLSPGNLVSQATDTVKGTARDTMHRATETASDTARRVAGSASDAASQVARFIPACRADSGISGARAPLVCWSAARGPRCGNLVDDEPPFERRGGMGRGRLHRREPLLRR